MPKHTDPGRDYYKDVGFSFVPPEGWAKSDPIMGCFMMYVNPPRRNGFLVSVNANVQPAGDDTIDKMMPEVKKALAGILANYKPVNEGKVTINGREAFYISATFGAGGRTIQNLQYGIFGGNKKDYIVTFSCLAEDYAANRPVFEKCAMSVLTD